MGQTLTVMTWNKKSKSHTKRRTNGRRSKRERIRESRHSAAASVAGDTSNRGSQQLNNNNNNNNNGSLHSNSSNRYVEPTMEISDIILVRAATHPFLNIPQVAEAFASRTNGESKNLALGMDPNRNMPLIYSLARSWAWGAVGYRCQTHPDEAAVVDYLGDNALHWAAFGRCPLNTVQQLLKANTHLVTVANKKGHLPLHVACSYKATAEVIGALLAAYPAAAGVATKAGSYPLHLLCDFGGSAEAIRLLLDTAEGLATVVKTDCIYKRKPLEILNGRKNLYEFQNARDNMRKIRLQQQALRLENRDNDHEYQKEMQRLRDIVLENGRISFWAKAAILAIAEYTQQPLPANRTIDELATSPDVLYACVANPDCPPSIQEFAILLFHDCLLKPVDGEARNLPLHLAAAQGSSCVVKDLVAYEPLATRMRNRDGDLPLTILIRNNPDRGWSGGVSCLLEAYPASLLDVGLDRRLYPYLWSRLGSSSSSSSLEVLFQILRSRPDVFL